MIDLYIIYSAAIERACAHMGADSPEATQLIFRTGIAESGYRHVRQVVSAALWDANPNKFARGVFQMEPTTHDDIWRWLRARPELAKRVEALSIRGQSAKELETNIWYAAAMCRAHYLRVREALPEHNEIEGQAAYWKRYYNTHHGKGTVQGFIDKVRAFEG